MKDDSRSESGRIRTIDAQSVHQICSGQVITNLSIAVKELIENAIDAGATIVEVKLQDYGATSIEIVDNGSGIAKEDFALVASKYATNKISTFTDIEYVQTFGFRGEALSSLCDISESFSIITRTAKDISGTHLTFSRTGVIVSNRSVARSVGTTIQISKLFGTLPVRRREFLRTIRRQYSQLLTLLQEYAIISAHVRFLVSNTNTGLSSAIGCTPYPAKGGGKSSTKDSSRGMKAAWSTPSSNESLPTSKQGRTVVLTTTGSGDILKAFSEVVGGGLSKTLQFFSMDLKNDLQEAEKRRSYRRRFLTDPSKNGPLGTEDICSSATGEEAVEDANGKSRTKPTVDSGNNANQENNETLQFGENVISEETLMNHLRKRLIPLNANKDGIYGYLSPLSEGVGVSSSDKQFVYLNGRPIAFPRLKKCILDTWRTYNMLQQPAYFLNICLQQCQYDVNVTPDKREVFITNENVILDALQRELHKVWEVQRRSVEVQSIVASDITEYLDEMEKAYSKQESAKSLTGSPIHSISPTSLSSETSDISFSVDQLLQRDAQTIISMAQSTRIPEPDKLPSPSSIAQDNQELTNHKLHDGYELKKRGYSDEPENGSDVVLALHSTSFDAKDAYANENLTPLANDLCSERKLDHPPTSRATSPRTPGTLEQTRETLSISSVASPNNFDTSFADSATSSVTSAISIQHYDEGVDLEETRSEDVFLHTPRRKQSKRTQVPVFGMDVSGDSPTSRTVPNDDGYHAISNQCNRSARDSPVRGVILPGSLSRKRTRSRESGPSGDLEVFSSHRLGNNDALFREAQERQLPVDQTEQYAESVVDRTSVSPTLDSMLLPSQSMFPTHLRNSPAVREFRSKLIEDKPPATGKVLPDETDKGATEVVAEYATVNGDRDIHPNVTDLVSEIGFTLEANVSELTGMNLDENEDSNVGEVADQSIEDKEVEKGATEVEPKKDADHQFRQESAPFDEEIALEDEFIPELTIPEFLLQRFRDGNIFPAKSISDATLTAQLVTTPRPQAMESVHDLPWEWHGLTRTNPAIVHDHADVEINVETRKQHSLSAANYLLRRVIEDLCIESDDIASIIQEDSLLHRAAEEIAAERGATVNEWFVQGNIVNDTQQRAASSGWTSSWNPRFQYQHPHQSQITATSSPILSSVNEQTTSRKTDDNAITDDDTAMYSSASHQPNTDLSAIGSSHSKWKSQALIWGSEVFHAESGNEEKQQVEQSLSRILTKDLFPKMADCIIGQFNAGFIIAAIPVEATCPSATISNHSSTMGKQSIAPLPLDLYILDQHASDEKNVYEHLFSTSVLRMQQLLIPRPIDLSPPEEQMVRLHSDTFSKNGFHFEFYPDNPPGRRVKLITVPYSKQVVFGDEDVRELTLLLQTVGLPPDAYDYSLGIVDNDAQNTWNASKVSKDDKKNSRLVRKCDSENKTNGDITSVSDDESNLVGSPEVTEEDKHSHVAAKSADHAALSFNECNCSSSTKKRYKYTVPSTIGTHFSHYHTSSSDSHGSLASKTVPSPAGSDGNLNDQDGFDPSNEDSNIIGPRQREHSTPLAVLRPFLRLPKLQHLFASRACRTSIMVGTVLNRSTMTRVVEQLTRLQHPWNCPHGRPTLRHLVTVDSAVRKPKLLAPG